MIEVLKVPSEYRGMQIFYQYHDERQDDLVLNDAKDIVYI
jgi:hypothetical protein